MPVGPPLRVGALLVLFLATPAHAAPGLDGLSVPSSGGGFASPADPGARGVFFQPAAVAHGERAELLMDIGLVGLNYTSQVGPGTPPESFATVAPQPSVSVAVPLGRFGVGGFIHAPYFRSAGGSGVAMVELGLVGAWRARDWLTVAAGARFGGAQFGLISDIDTGEFLNENAGLEGKFELPVNDPLLQGEQRVSQRIGVGVSPMFGATVHLGGGAQIHATFRPRWVIPIRGDVSLQPSLDLGALVEGDVRVRMPFPLRAGLSATIPIGRVTLLPEVELIDWARSSDVDFDLQNLRLATSDPLWNIVLNEAGLAEAEFLDAAEGPQVYALGWNTVVQPALQAEVQLTEVVDVRAGVLWGRSAVPDAVVDPTNVDFETVAIRLGGAWRALPSLRVAGTLEAFPGPARRVASGMPGPSFFRLALWRAGVTAQVYLDKAQD